MALKGTILPVEPFSAEGHEGKRRVKGQHGSEANGAGSPLRRLFLSCHPPTHPYKRALLAPDARGELPPWIKPARQNSTRLTPCLAKSWTMPAIPSRCRRACIARGRATRLLGPPISLDTYIRNNCRQGRMPCAGPNDETPTIAGVWRR